MPPCLVAGSLICFGDAAVKAAVVINVRQSGSDVIFNYSGSRLNLTDLVASPSQELTASFIDPASGSFALGGKFYDAYQFSGSFEPFGNGNLSALVSGSTSGASFALVNVNGTREVRINQGYVSNELFGGEVVFRNASFLSLGLEPGSHTTTLQNNDTITMNIGAVPAPLPLLGLGAATAFSRKLKQRIALRRKREEVGAVV